MKIVSVTKAEKKGMLSLRFDNDSVELVYDEDYYGLGLYDKQEFLLEDISSAEEYALYALEILENQKKGGEWGSDKISDILEFLVEIYDLKKDFNSVLSLYEKLYYLNAGKFGINSPQAMKYKIKKENFEYKLENDYQIYFRGTQNNKSKNH